MPRKVKVKKSFAANQTVKIVSGTFAGRTGTVHFVGDSGRVFVANIKGGVSYDAHGRKSSKPLPGSFFEPEELE